ncbi:MAG: hypothetical protein Q9160_005259 [Pyrenula sp. 1 TL-2023]
MSAIAESEVSSKPIQVLFTLHAGFDTLDFTGPLEMLVSAKNENGSPAFEATTCAPTQGITSGQGVTVKADMDFATAHTKLSDFDILVIPGGSTDEVLKTKSEPLGLIRKWADLQKRDPSRERTLFSICTGSLFLAQAGVLQGLAATTHPAYYTRLEKICQEAAAKDMGARTDVMEERYVVNNARFDLGERLEENPFVLDKKPDGRRKSIARKGSDAWKASRRRESLVRRGTLPLGGLRVVTAGGVTAGLDAALYLVAALVSFDAAVKDAEFQQYTWQKGVTVEGIDV